jgi:hypothetical protein
MEPYLSFLLFAVAVAFGGGGIIGIGDGLEV